MNVLNFGTIRGPDHMICAQPRVGVFDNFSQSARKLHNRNASLKDLAGRAGTSGAPRALYTAQKIPRLMCSYVGCSSTLQVNGSLRSKHQKLGRRAPG